MRGDQRMKKPTKRQHYVPQVYLKRWAHCNGRLWAYDKPTRGTHEPRPKDVAREAWFYEDGSRPVNEIECRLQAHENVLTKKLAPIDELATGAKPSAEQLEWLIEATTIQLFRSKAHRLFIKEVTGRPEEDAARAQNQFLDDIERLIEWLGSWAAILVDAPRGLQWWTTDRPAILMPSPDEQHIPCDQNTEGAFILYPVSPRRALVLEQDQANRTIGGSDGEVRLATAGIYWWIQGVQAVQATRQIYSRQNDLMLADELVAIDERLRDEERPRTAGDRFDMAPVWQRIQAAK